MRSFAATLLLLLCAACASPDPTTVIPSFAAATQDAGAAIKAYDAAASKRLTAIGIAKVLADPARAPFAVAPLANGCETSSTACTLGYQLRSSETLKPLAFDTLIPQTAEIADHLSSYAAALNELAAADSKDKVSAALGKVNTAVSAAANIVMPGTAPAAAAALGPVTEGLAWLYGKYQDNLKARALREATAEMNPVVQAAADQFGKMAKLAATADSAVAVTQFNDAQKTYEDQPSESNLRAYLQAASDLNGVLKAPQVGAVFASLAAAHDKLTQALDGRIKSFADLEATVARLADDAQTLHKLADDFKTATQ